jgi:aminotransferase
MESNSNPEDSHRSSALSYLPPMGVYETLFRFLDVTGKYMGTSGTHPWVQGCPLTTTLPHGPEIPTQVTFTSTDLKYPSATGQTELLTAICNYYNHFYSTNLTNENICIFAGGRCGIYVTLSLLQSSYQILLEEAEYTPYYDLMKTFQKNYQIIPSNVENNFTPSIETYRSALNQSSSSSSSIPTSTTGKVFILKSNPCNPTGVTRTGEELKQFADFCSEPNHGGLFDEAYEFFHNTPDSILRYIPDINNTNIFISAAATKGLQAPGLRIGWIIASRENIELFRNYSGIGMGGVSRPAQILVTSMLEIERVTQARVAVNEYYSQQRARYGHALQEMGFKLYTGTGGFYHWCQLPDGMNCTEFNERLYRHDAAILPGSLCDVFRRGDTGPMGQFIRFSFGPLLPDSFEDDIRILKACLVGQEERV